LFIVFILLTPDAVQIMFSYRNSIDMMRTHRAPLAKLSQKPKSMKTKSEKAIQNAESVEFYNVRPRDLEISNEASLRQTFHKTKCGDSSNALLTSTSILKSSTKTKIGARCPVIGCTHNDEYLDRTGAPIQSHFPIVHAERFESWAKSGFPVWKVASYIDVTFKHKSYFKLLSLLILLHLLFAILI
jgi:hypothetical protein